MIEKNSKQGYAKPLQTTAIIISLFIFSSAWSAPHDHASVASATGGLAISNSSNNAISLGSSYEAKLTDNKFDKSLTVEIFQTNEANQAPRSPVDTIIFDHREAQNMRSQVADFNLYSQELLSNLESISQMNLKTPVETREKALEKIGHDFEKVNKTFLMFSDKTMRIIAYSNFIYDIDTALERSLNLSHRNVNFDSALPFEFGKKRMTVPVAIGITVGISGVFGFLSNPDMPSLLAVLGAGTTVGAIMALERAGIKNLMEKQRFKVLSNQALQQYQRMAELSKQAFSQRYKKLTRKCRATF